MGELNAYSIHDMETDHGSDSRAVNGMPSRIGTWNDVRGICGIAGGCDWAVGVATVLLLHHLLLKVYLDCE